MINNKKIIAFIPARGGSKGIKDKNIIDLKGKPLIYYTINAAKKSKYIDEVIVSTDSPAIASVAKSIDAFVPFLRPETLASDDSNVMEAIMYSLAELKCQGTEFDILILLQPTSPFRNSKHIDEALETFIKNDLKGLLSVCEAEKNPALFRKIETQKLTPIIKSEESLRQKMDKYYILNGAIYINKTKELEKGIFLKDNEVPYIMDKYHSLDIDEKIDLLLAEQLINSNLIKF